MSKSPAWQLRFWVGVFTVLLLACCGVSVAGADTIYVDDDAPNDPGPGDPAVSDPLEDGSPEHPFDAIQEGIDAAVDGDLVLVADGTYAGVGNRDLDFDGKLITVQSESYAFRCRIDCEDESIGAYFHSGESGKAVLDGFLILNAHVEGSHSGAVVCDGASPTISRCWIAGSDGAGLYGRNAGPNVRECWMEHNAGAGVSCYNASPTLSDCDIDHNSAEGVKCQDSDLLLTTCSVRENADTGISCYGGSAMIGNTDISGNAVFGVYCEHNELSVTGGWVRENGWGGIWCQRGSATIRGCRVQENFCTFPAGGGIVVDGGDATISHCTISRNVGYVWGGVYLWGDNLVVADCTITRNFAVHPVAMSAGILVGPVEATIQNCTIAMNLGGYLGGGIGVFEGRATVCNSVIARNDSTAYGGGIYCEYSGGATLINCTVVENTSGDIGAALCCEGTSATLVNSIVRNNWDPEGLPLVVDGDGPQTALAVSYCNIEDGEAAVSLEGEATLRWGPGNIDADPLFVDPDVGDYHASPGSPCIDSGCNWAVPPDSTDLDDDGDTDEITPLDLDGEGRFFDDPDTPDTGCGWPPIVDMGAYEFGDTGPQPCFGDLDDDRDVDLDDLALLLVRYGESDVCEGDLDCDGDVDLSDLAALLAAYGMYCE
jgi:hypothetical protein